MSFWCERVRHHPVRPPARAGCARSSAASLPRCAQRVASHPVLRIERRGSLGRLYRAGQLDEAITLVQKALTLERAVFGALGDNGMTWLSGLAKLQHQREQFSGAVASRRQLLALKTQRYGADDWRVVDAKLDLEDSRLWARLSASQRQKLKQRHDSYWHL